MGTKTDAIQCDDDTIRFLRKYNKDWCIKQISNEDYETLQCCKHNIDEILNKYEAS